MKAFAAPKSSTKLELERRALLIQLGGYSYKGREVLFSTSGQRHLQAVTERKTRAARIEAAALRNAQGERHGD
jgi:hypothetical protein